MHHFFMLALTFAASFGAGVAHAGCEKDTDCKGERICESSLCVDPKSTNGSTETNTESNGGTPDTATNNNESSEGTPDTATNNNESNATGNGEDVPDSDKKDVVPTNPEDWWKQEARESEAPVLQAIFDQMPRPIRKKGNAKLVYQRAVPVVISDIHETTHRWGGKTQIGVHFLGISKIHTTTTLDPINSETAGIPYCPVNCARITDIKMMGDQLNFLYDGPIKEWAGNVGDNAAGYIRQVGKQYKATCSLPIMFNHAPKNSWLDPDQVQAVRDNAVTEIKRYCGMD